MGVRHNHFLIFRGPRMRDKESHHLDVADMLPDLDTIAQPAGTSVRHAVVCDNVPMSEDEPSEKMIPMNSEMPLNAPDSDPGM